MLRIARARDKRIEWVLGDFRSPCLSGAYDLVRGSCGISREAIAAFSPASYVTTLGGPQLEQLRHRTIILGSGEGDYETPADSKRMSDAFASKSIPCRLSLWGPARDHTWSTWREMLPRLVAEQL